MAEKTLEDIIAETTPGGAANRPVLTIVDLINRTNKQSNEPPPKYETILDLLKDIQPTPHKAEGAMLSKMTGKIPTLPKPKPSLTSSFYNLELNDIEKKSLRESSRKYRKLAEKAYATLENPAYPKDVMVPLILSVLSAESRGNPMAKSPIKKEGGARGLMQVMPSTGKELASKIDAVNEKKLNLNDPETSVILGSHYINSMLNSEGGNVLYGLSKYNYGPTNVSKIKGKIKDEDKSFEKAYELLPDETKGYVANVLSRYKELTGQEFKH